MNNNLDLELIKAYLDQHFDNPPKNLTLESKLDEIGLDSLAQLELMMELEDKYNFRMPEDFPKPETVADLLALVEQYKPAAVNA